MAIINGPLEQCGSQFVLSTTNPFDGVRFDIPMNQIRVANARTTGSAFISFLSTVGTTKGYEIVVGETYLGGGFLFDGFGLGTISTSTEIGGLRWQALRGV